MPRLAATRESRVSSQHKISPAASVLVSSPFFTYPTFSPPHSIPLLVYITAAHHPPWLHHVCRPICSIHMLRFKLTNLRATPHKAHRSAEDQAPRHARGYECGCWSQARGCRHKRWRNRGARRYRIHTRHATRTDC